jgi:hypothetical protein
VVTSLDSCLRLEILRALIARDRGEEDAQRYERYQATDFSLVGNLGQELLAHTPVLHGACAAMSAAWVALLRDRHDVPAVAVAGDLIIEGFSIFVADRNVPQSTDLADMTPWDGHCWMEIDGHVGDASIFRTVRTINRPSRLRDFIERQFGLQRGLMLAEHADLTRAGMSYVPKYVLTETQINALLAGLKHQIELTYAKQ